MWHCSLICRCERRTPSLSGGCGRNTAARTARVSFPMGHHNQHNGASQCCGSPGRQAPLQLGGPAAVCWQIETRWGRRPTGQPLAIGCVCGRVATPPGSEDGQGYSWASPTGIPAWSCQWHAPAAPCHGARSFCGGTHAASGSLPPSQDLAKMSHA